MQISRFFKFAIDPDTIYVRIDDDVVWMVEGCIEALVQHRVQYPDAYLVYANIVNSSRFMHLHQKQGAFDPGFEISYEISHPTNRLSVPAAVAAHRALLDTAEALATAGGDRAALLDPWTRFERHVFAAGEHNDCQHDHLVRPRLRRLARVSARTRSTRSSGSACGCRASTAAGSTRRAAPPSARTTRRRPSGTGSSRAPTSTTATPGWHPARRSRCRSIPARRPFPFRKSIR